MLHYCTRFGHRVNEVKCLTCRYCLPPAERTNGRMCDKEITDRETIEHWEHCDEVCYGREDLLRVAEKMAEEFGNSDIDEELCGVMADAAAQYMKNIKRN